MGTAHRKVRERRARRRAIQSAVVSVFAEKGFSRDDGGHRPPGRGVRGDVVHLSETRKNLGVTISTLKDLHRKAFAWFEEGLRAN